MEAVKGARINRYIVGCKLPDTVIAGVRMFRINRYIVGCKYVLFVSVQSVNRN